MSMLGRMAKRNAYLDIRNLVTDDSPVIVDGGAHNGSVIDTFLSLYKSPRIISFEPIPDLTTHLKASYRLKQNVEIKPYVQGVDDKTVNCNITRNLGSSSTLKPSNTKGQYHGSHVKIDRDIEVQMVRLATVLHQVSMVDILKLDLQGSELDALRGCSQLLNNIKVIYSQVEFTSLYENQILFSDIDQFLQKQGFRLYNLYDLWTHPDGQLTSGYALYINTNYFNDNNRIDSRYIFYSVGFHGDSYLLELAMCVLNRSTVFIETGANVGTTLSYVATECPQMTCLSCEPDDKAFSLTCINANYPLVKIYNEMSQDFLKRLTVEYSHLFHKTCTFWLDAHGYGFEWPLQDELYFITRCFSSAFIFIDDFKIPHLKDVFTYDTYKHYECSLDFVKTSLNPLHSYIVCYPNYTDRTSTHHPLVGWGLLIFGNGADLEIPPSLNNKLLWHKVTLRHE